MYEFTSYGEQSSRFAVALGMNTTISASEFSHLIASGKAPHIVDVRTPVEFAVVHVQGARFMPLDELDPRKVTDALKPGDADTIYLLCKSGARSHKAVEKFHEAGFGRVCVVEGGTDACVAAGVPVQRGKVRIPLEGQVRIAIGTLILLGWVGAWWMPVLAYIIPFMALGLIFAGASGFCGLAILMAKAPWNKDHGVACCRVC